MSYSANKVFVGKGEFQLRDVHAVAEVEISDGIIQRIKFSSGTGTGIEGAHVIENLLKGQPVSQALEVKAQNLGSGESRSEIAINTALLEAFHRAIESYIDEQ